MASEAPSYTYADPWSNVQKNTFAPQRTGSKRRRRALFSISKKGDGSTGGASDPGQEDDAPALQYESEPDSCLQSNAPSRRKMRPAVSWMSVKVERRALQEIRSIKEIVQQEAQDGNPELDSRSLGSLTMDLMLGRATQRLQSIDMSMEEFALHYVSGHSQKRGQGGSSIQYFKTKSSSIDI